MANVEKMIVGLPLEEAKAWLNANSIQYRIRTLNGKGMIGTCDMKPFRANLNVNNDIVVSVTFG
jgi:hypothetical protein